jgi:hypothetical protein
MTQTLSPLWYQYYDIISEDAPEILDQYIEETAAKLELTVDYFTAEFTNLSVDLKSNP